jgi:hypothetical protein
MRFFRRRISRRAAAIEVAPEFGVRVTLRKGDKIVRRDARGAIQVEQVTEESMDLDHVHPTARRGRAAG